MLLDEWVAPIPLPTKDEALSILARNYFRSHALATLDDFCWWSGLSVKEARLGVEIIEKEFQKVVFNDKTYLLHESSSIDIKEKDLSFCLLTTNTSLPTSIAAMFCKLLTTAKHLLTVFSFPLSYKMVGRRVIGKWLWHAETSPSTRLTLITTPPTNLSAAEEKARLQLISFHN